MLKVCLSVNLKHGFKTERKLLGKIAEMTGIDQDTLRYPSACPDLQCFHSFIHQQEKNAAVSVLQTHFLELISAVLTNCASYISDNSIQTATETKVGRAGEIKKLI